jgi:predicted nucleic acid-binding protein
MLKLREHPMKEQLHTSAISIAELTSVACRRGAAGKVDQILGFVRRLSTVEPLTNTILEAAGRIHAADQDRPARLSLADAIILAQAHDTASTLVTTDVGLVKNRHRVNVLRVG